MAKKTKSKAKGSCRMLPVMHPDAAGVDIGAEEIFVAVPADRDVESVQSFDTFTRDLHQLADWLQSCRVRTVAMESTGVYWIPLYHMQKALSQMNLQLHHVLSEITGVSGLAILDAILAGERDPAKLASLCNWRVRSSRETVASHWKATIAQSTYLRCGSPLLVIASIRSSSLKSTRNLNAACETFPAPPERLSRCRRGLRHVSINAQATNRHLI